MNRPLTRSIYRPLVLFAVTFSLSGFWILFNPQRPLPDATLYEGIAVNLAQGNGFSFDRQAPYRPEITRTPLLPVYIAGVYKLCGRRPQVLLWLNSLWIALAVVLGYQVALKLFADEKIAWFGGWFAALTPYVSGAANNILTEPLAMVQFALAIWLILRWPGARSHRLAPIWGGLLGLLLASLVLNRPSFTPAVLVGGAYVALSLLREQLRQPKAWLTATIFVFCLGLPVLGWSARNASLGLKFSPAPVGISASRILDLQRYKQHFFEPGWRLPAVTAQYFAHWKKRFGPQELQQLEKENKQWIEPWLDQNSDKVVRATPYRLLGLFSSFRISIFPIWHSKHDRVLWPIFRWLSRVLWLLSFVGLVLLGPNPRARAIWLVAVGTLVVVHLMTVCNPRYMITLMPVLMPFCAVLPILLRKRQKRC